MLNVIEVRDRYLHALLGPYGLRAPEQAWAHATSPMPRPERMEEGKRRLMRLAAERRATLRA